MGQEERDGRRDEQPHGAQGGESWLQAGLEGRGRLGAAWDRDPAAAVCKGFSNTCDSGYAVILVAF